LTQLRDGAINNQNIFSALMDAVRVCSLGQITHALFEVGGAVPKKHVTSSGVSASGPAPKRLSLLLSVARRKGIMAGRHCVGVPKAAVSVLDANLAPAKLPHYVFGGQFCSALFAVNAFWGSNAALLHRPALAVFNNVTIMFAHAQAPVG